MSKDREGSVGSPCDSLTDRPRPLARAAALATLTERQSRLRCGGRGANWHEPGSNRLFESFGRSYVLLIKIKFQNYSKRRKKKELGYMRPPERIDSFGGGPSGSSFEACTERYCRVTVRPCTISRHHPRRGL